MVKVSAAELRSNLRQSLGNDALRCSNSWSVFVRYLGYLFY